MEIYELIFNEQELFEGVTAISIVDRPAIESNFIALKDSKPVTLATIDEEKRVLLGALLIPEMPIYRKDDEKEFYVYFSRDTIRKVSEVFLKSGKQSNFTLQHNMVLNGLSIVESWIKEDDEKDKSNLYGFTLPVGTWFCSVKVDNEDVWQEFVKSGTVKGFSIEGLFSERSIYNRSDKGGYMGKREEMIKFFKKPQEKKEVKMAEFEAADGFTIYVEVLEVGQPVYAMTEQGQIPLPAGEYALTDGQTLVVSEDSVITEIRPSAQPAPPQEAQFVSMDDYNTLSAKVAALEEQLAQVIVKKEELNTELVAMKQTVDEQKSKIVELSATPATPPITPNPEGQGKQPSDPLKLATNDKRNSSVNRVLANIEKYS